MDIVDSYFTMIMECHLLRCIGTIILQEWDKYKVKALDGSLVPEDFIKVGEFGDEEFGTLLFKNCIGIAKFKGLLIYIESSKISSDEMDRLMSVVNTYIVKTDFLKECRRNAVNSNVFYGIDSSGWVSPNI